MRLKKNIHLVDFIKKVKECTSEVFLVTQDGDRLNLKSALSQYVFVTLSAQDELLKNSRIICTSEDEEKLTVFLERE